jgi:hypothetical protein
MGRIHESSESFLHRGTRSSAEGLVNCRAGKENSHRSAVSDASFLPVSCELKPPDPAGRAGCLDPSIFDTLVFHCHQTKWGAQACAKEPAARFQSVLPVNDGYRCETLLSASLDTVDVSRWEQFALLALSHESPHHLIAAPY